MDNVRGLFFDVGGTVFDWKNTARERIVRLAEQKGQAIDDEAFADDWRREMFKIHTQVRQGNLPWINSDAMHLRALGNMTGAYPLLASVDRYPRGVGPFDLAPAQGLRRRAGRHRAAADPLSPSWCSPS